MVAQNYLTKTDTLRHMTKNKGMSGGNEKGERLNNDPEKLVTAATFRS